MTISRLFKDHALRIYEIFFKDFKQNNFEFAIEFSIISQNHVPQGRGTSVIDYTSMLVILHLMYNIQVSNRTLSLF